MDKINDGGPAFPSLRELGDIATTDAGMTLRDYFATHCNTLGDKVSTDLAVELAATQGVTKPGDNQDTLGWHRYWCAVHSAHRYMMADAMLAARDKP